MQHTVDSAASHAFLWLHPLLGSPNRPRASNVEARDGIPTPSALLNAQAERSLIKAEEQIRTGGMGNLWTVDSQIGAADSGPVSIGTFSIALLAVNRTFQVGPPREGNAPPLSRYARPYPHPRAFVPVLSWMRILMVLGVSHQNLLSLHRYPCIVKKKNPTASGP